MSDPDKKPLLPLLTSVLTEHLREFGDLAKRDLHASLAELKDELGTHHFQERLEEFAKEARSQLEDGLAQFKRELEAELAEVRSRRAEQAEEHAATADRPPADHAGSRDEASATNGGTSSPNGAPRVRVVDDPSERDDS